jgi:hypothetical protein
MASRMMLIASMVTGCGRIAFDSSCRNGACPGLVSMYTFDEVTNLGHDSIGPNDMTDVVGTPAQASEVPPGQTGHSIQLDGSSSVCTVTTATFAPSSDHTLCWWTKPSPGIGDQFVQNCTYDTWTGGATTLRWTINNCAGREDFDIPDVYVQDTWVHICQTYQAATRTRTVIVNGQQSYARVDANAIGVSDKPWCIGSYGNGSFWIGLMYRPMWFDRVLSMGEIQTL